MLSTFSNIDGAQTVTRWKSDPHNEWFYNLGSPSEYRLGYTIVEAEVPVISSGDDEAYWNTSPSNKTKLSTWNVFRTRYLYLESSLKVFIDGVRIEGTTHSGTGEFTVPVVTDGYMFVSYTPAIASYTAGNKTSTLNAAGIRSRYLIPKVKADHIIRCRKAINNLQYHAEYAVTPWIGGAWNSEMSESDNLIVSKTEIYSDHILEMRSALLSLATRINNYNPGNETSGVTLSFSTVADTSYFRVEYVEEIRYAINVLEGEIIRKLSL